MNIKTGRLLIRQFESKDWETVYEYTSDSNVMKYMPEGVFSHVDAKVFVNKNIGKKAENFPLILFEENILLGHIIFHKYFGDHTYEIGWVLHPNYQNKGYVTEAAQAILDFGFKQMNLHRIIATCQPENIASWKKSECEEKDFLKNVFQTVMNGGMSIITLF